MAGQLVRREANRLSFGYGQGYLARADAIPIYHPELPLRRGLQAPSGTLELASCLRDASPDAWGRRVIMNRVAHRSGEAGVVDELAYLMESGSDRIGALDFQASAQEYVPRGLEAVSLGELAEAADRLDRGMPLTPALDLALNHGTSIGGARPKALVRDGAATFIAKFSAQNDVYSVVRAEFVAMRLAALAGLDVAPVRMAHAAQKDVLLVKRFDRVDTNAGVTRRAMVSALTMLGLDEMMARYASYQDLAEVVRRRFTRPKATLRELFGRIVFNVLCGNTDDHARNHAAFWDGEMLTLTPAYDVCPQGRTGQEASQAMLIVGQDRSSSLSTCLAAAPAFGLSARGAAELAEAQMQLFRTHWTEVCDEAGFSDMERRVFVGRQVLNPFAFHGTGRLEVAARDVRDALLSGYSRTT